MGAADDVKSSNNYLSVLTISNRNTNMVRPGAGLVLMVMMALSFLVATHCTTDHDDFNKGRGWKFAHATFYGDEHGNETMQGACGYGDLFKQKYGLETTALSTVLFKDGSTCGACYQIMCTNSTRCLPGAPVIRVTATNFCPPNYTKAEDIWCNPPQEHFDLSLPMFKAIAEYEAGIVPVAYRRVRCVKEGGMKFELKGNPHWLLVLVFNVGGSGQVVDVKVKGSGGGNWIRMSRNWGQNWQTGVMLVGQGLSFRVTTSDGKTAVSENVVPPNWEFGGTYEGKNIH